MIKYSLRCDKEHVFEGWFSTGQDFDKQKKRGLVSCPFCNSININKTLMSPSISTGTNKAPEPELPQQKSKNALVATPPKMPASYGEMVTQMRKIRDHIQANSENVGVKFSDEARKIHYGETKKRSIYGQANLQDVKELVEEGIEVMSMPELPEDNN